MASFIASNSVFLCCPAANQCPRVLVSQRAANGRIRSNVGRPVQCIANLDQLSTSTTTRRSGNYLPTSWDDNYLQSLTNNYSGDTYKKRAEKLKEKVRLMIGDNVGKPIDQLELIDTLQRLGLAYHFNTEIENILHTFYNNSDVSWKKGNLHATSLEFRLLRQYGYNVSQETFNVFMDETGSFKRCLCGDIKGMLSLYEASYYGLEGESIMEEAWQFTTKHLKDKLKDDMDVNVAVELKHALDLPIHWTPTKFGTKWFIDVYEKREDMNHLLLELAKLDFNILQNIYHEDLKDLSSWWSNSALGEKLSFFRDRLVQSFLWAVGVASEPQNSFCRKMIAKAIILITLLDDIYDVYGNLAELEFLTECFERGDTKAMEKLPHYMKLAFLFHYTYVNKMAYDILKEKDSYIIPSLRKTWASAFKANMVEARWYHTQYTPTLEEYLDNAWITITGPTISLITYLSNKSTAITEKELQFLESSPELIRLCATVFRLQDDLGTASDEIKRGDVSKAIQCYMHHTGASEEDAREHIKDLTRQLWKKINGYRTAADNPLSRNMTEMMLNVTRVSHAVYLTGDGFGVEGVIDDIISSLLFQPIPLIS